MKLPQWLTNLVGQAEHELEQVLTIEAMVAPWLAAAKLLPDDKRLALEAALHQVQDLLKPFETHVQQATTPATAPPPAAPAAG